MSAKLESDGRGECAWLLGSLSGSRVGSCVAILGLGGATDAQTTKCQNILARLGSPFGLIPRYFFNCSAQNLVRLGGHMWVPSLPSHALCACVRVRACVCGHVGVRVRVCSCMRKCVCVCDPHRGIHRGAWFPEIGRIVTGES